MRTIGAAKKDWIFYWSEMSYSNKIAVFATIPVTVDFVMSGLLTNGAVMRLRFLFRELENSRGGLFNRVI